MSYQTFSKDYIDANGNNIIFSDDVRLSKYYNTLGESWDKSGGGTASWYTEILQTIFGTKEDIRKSLRKLNQLTSLTIGLR